MKIAYAARSREDLGGIVDRLGLRNPHAALVVAATIRKRIAWLARYPESGRRQDHEGVRKAVTEPFGYAIYYAIDEAAPLVTILSIIPPALDRS